MVATDNGLLRRAVSLAGKLRRSGPRPARKRPGPSLAAGVVEPGTAASPWIVGVRRRPDANRLRKRLGPQDVFSGAGAGAGYQRSSAAVHGGVTVNHPPSGKC